MSGWEPPRHLILSYSLAVRDHLDESILISRDATRQAYVDGLDAITAAVNLLSRRRDELELAYAAHRWVSSTIAQEEASDTTG